MKIVELKPTKSQKNFDSKLKKNYFILPTFGKDILTKSNQVFRSLRLISLFLSQNLLLYFIVDPMKYFTAKLIHF